MAVVKTSAKGQVVIPADVRVRAGLQPGGRVVVSFDEARRQVIIEPLPADPIKATFGMLGRGRSLTTALRAARKAENARDTAQAARLLRAAGVSGRRGKR
jgi:AbrB family looped-hinge helix DNA binding protein